MLTQDNLNYKEKEEIIDLKLNICNLVNFNPENRKHLFLIKKILRLIAR